MAKFTIRQRKDYTIEANSIEDAFNLLIENMSEIDADNFPVDLSFDTCEDIEHLEKIEVSSVDYNKSNDGTIPNFTIQIRIYFNSPDFRNFDSLLYELSNRFTKTLGSNVNWKVLDQINHYDNLKN